MPDRLSEFTLKTCTLFHIAILICHFYFFDQNLTYLCVRHGHFIFMQSLLIPDV